MIRTRPIRTLLSMACDGKGPSATCIALMNATYLAGYQADVFALRRRIPRQPVKIYTPLPRPFAYFPHRWTAQTSQTWLEEQFLKQINAGDIAYLWPNVSLQTHRKLKERGIPIVMEGINTRMASAKRILDAAYEALGEPPSHSITDARIEEEEEKYRFANAIFAPNIHVERALIGSPLEHAILPTSYGVEVGASSGPRNYGVDGKPVTFMFCGYACVRKGVHFLLEAFSRLGGKHKLQIVGGIEPLILERYSRILQSDRIELTGFVKNVHPYFAKADIFVFPSLEEGGPLVSYEAALHSLPIVASPMGSGRLGDVAGKMNIIDPSDCDAFTSALEKLANSAAYRTELGQSARISVEEYDWNKVGARRAQALQSFFVDSDHKASSA